MPQKHQHIHLSSFADLISYLISNPLSFSCIIKSSVYSRSIESRRPDMNTRPIRTSLHQSPNMSLCRRMANLCLETPLRPTSIPRSPGLISHRHQSTARTPPARTPRQPSTSDIAAATHYPHGPSNWYKQSNRGLYGSAKIQFGNNVSAKNEIKTRRHWSPNIKQKYLYSTALGRSVQARVSTRVLRTIDKVGGLDAYLLKDTAARVRDLGIHGWRLRCQIVGSGKMQAEFNHQREALGLPTLDYRAVTEEAVEAGVPTNLGRLTGVGRRSVRFIRRRR